MFQRYFKWQNDVRFAAKVRSLATTYRTRTTVRRADLIRIFNRYACNFQTEARVACVCAPSALRAAKLRKPLEDQLCDRCPSLSAVV